MRLKLGFLLRSLLAVGSFLGLLVLWSSLSPRPDDPSPLSRLRGDRDVDDPMPDRGGAGLAPGDDRFKPVVPWPHVEGVEVDLESIRRKNKARNGQQRHAGGDDQRDIMQRRYLTFKPQTFTYRDPVLRPGILGNFEPKEPEPHGVVGGPGEKAKPLVLGPEFKHAVQASIKEFGFNMVASDMISLDRSVSDLRQEDISNTCESRTPAATLPRAPAREDRPAEPPGEARVVLPAVGASEEASPAVPLPRSDV